MTADATSAGEFLPVSPDAHVNEPHDLWYERLPLPHSQKVTGKLFAEVMLRIAAGCWRTTPSRSSASTLRSCTRPSRRPEMAAASGSGVMAGVRVLEVPGWTYVPAAGAVLAEWGADVLKIEHPETGDPQRGLITSGLVQVREFTATSDVFLMNFLPAARGTLVLEREHDGRAPESREAQRGAGPAISRRPGDPASSSRTSARRTPTSSTSEARARVSAVRNGSAAAMTAARSGRAASRTSPARQTPNGRLGSRGRHSAT